MGSTDEDGSLRGEAERLRADAAKREREAPSFKKALKASREAGWGAESDGLVKLLTFLGVMIRESMPQRMRRTRPPLIVEAVRVRPVGNDSHPHIAEIRLTDGATQPAEEVVFGIRYRRDTYISALEDGSSTKLIVSRCPSCGRDRLTTETSDDLLLAMRQF